MKNKNLKNFLVFSLYAWLAYLLLLEGAYSELAGKDLFFYNKVIDAFRQNEFSLIAPFGNTGSAEPLFWVIIYVFSNTGATYEIVYLATLMFYVFCGLFIAKNNKSIYLLFLLVSIGTVIFSHSIGNNFRNYCALTLLSAILIRRFDEHPRNDNILVDVSFFSLLICTHYSAGMVYLIFASLNMSLKRKVVFAIILGCSMLTLLNTEFGQNIIYKVNVYIQSNSIQRKNATPFYLLFLVTMIVLLNIHSKRLHLSVSLVTSWFLVIVMFCGYYFYDFYAFGRLANYGILFCYIYLLRVFKTPLTRSWKILPIIQYPYLQFRLMLGG